MLANVASELIRRQPGPPRTRDRLDLGGELTLHRPRDIGEGALLALARIVIEEHREVPVALGMLVAPGARAEQHDALDAIA